MPVIRQVTTRNGVTVKAVAAPNARATFVPLPTQAPGRSAATGAAVPAVLAPNARQTHVR